ncbi:hypothetical protein BDW59DRAFT_100233 [Aspergillus cavernicola]|uniref:NAD(P)-binding protein n=1 Tax=Aspergillus cavernicola TaxID=176166 RepID=A0ABR4I6C1_9EURO
MVSLDTVQQTNSTIKKYGPGLAGVFVGGTSGIGEATARSFVEHATSPRVYLIGRNEAQASKIIEELTRLNSESQIRFVKCDVSLLRRVDEACRSIQEKEEKVNLLFMSSGIFTTKGRDETEEGLDKKLSLHYYSRMRFLTNLLPQLNAASQVNTSEAEAGLVQEGLSSVISILGAGGEGSLVLDDLSLKNNYSIRNCAKHAITMTSLSVETLAKSHPSVSFVHSYPGVVSTGLMRDFNVVARTMMRVLFTVAKPFTVPVEESGQRHLYAAILKAGQPHLVGWDGEPRGNQRVLSEYREKKTGEAVWKHTLDIFNSICG